MTGMLRINATEMEVFNGSSWQMIPSSYATVSMDQDVLDIVQWARKKRDEEMTWQSLAKDNKAVKIALDNLEQAKEQLKITAHLAKEEYETTS
jgi:3-dehydroquinate synthase class II